MERSLAEIDANRMYLHVDDPLYQKVTPPTEGESSGGSSH
jgi:hypothetical protein